MATSLQEILEDVSEKKDLSFEDVHEYILSFCYHGEYIAVAFSGRPERVLRMFQAISSRIPTELIGLPDEGDTLQ